MLKGAVLLINITKKSSGNRQEVVEDEQERGNWELNVVHETMHVIDPFFEDGVVAIVRHWVVGL